MDVLEEGFVVLLDAGEMVWLQLEGEGAMDFFQSEGEAENAGHIETLLITSLHEIVACANEKGTVVLDIPQSSEEKEI